MAETKQYSYYAFISYSRKDEKWAKWLQTQLETYRLPAAVRKKHVDVPRRISPVFRDKTDLTSGRLEEVLQQELDSSKYLIVICSPNSAASPWVNKEISRFIQTGREEQIIPFIVEGVPGGEPECFPPALKNDVQKQLLGIDATEVGRVPAFLQVAAAMLGLKYDELYRRHRRRVLRRRITGALCGAAVLAVAGAVGWYLTPHSAYYANYVTRYEIPEGVNELDDKQREGLSEFYRIVTKRGKPVLLERVNAAGGLVEPAVPEPGLVYPRIAFVYSDGGQLSRIEIYDAQEKMIQQRIFSYDSGNRIAVDLMQPGETLRAATMPDDATSGSVESVSNGRSNIVRLLNEYDEEGFLIESLFQRDSLNTRTCDANGVYGVRYAHDAQGLVISALNLNDIGRAHNTRYGVAEKQYEYDGQGRVVLAAAYNDEGKPVLGEDGYAQLAVERDAKGNAVSLRYLDEQGHLCNIPEKYARAEIAYDEQGRRISMRLYDAAGEPAYDTNGVHETRFTYDDKGRLASASYYDGGGEAQYCLDGYFCARYTYDEEGRESSFLTYDTQGQLCCGYHGTAGYRRTYNEDVTGSTTSITTIGPDGEPAPRDEGYYTMRRMEGEYGRPFLEEYLDENGEPTDDIYGVSTNRYVYDMAGNLFIKEYFDSKGGRCLKDGVSSIWYEYENSRCVQVCLFGTDMEPISPDGWWELRVDYDEQGNVVCFRYYDEQGDPVQDGCARMEQTVDSRGNVVEQRYYDADGKPCQYDDGYEAFWKVEQEYDRWGYLVRRSLYSLTGQYRHGSNTQLRQYDERHNLVRQDYQDADGQPGVSDDGTSAYINTYDERNMLLRQEYLDLDGQPGNSNGISAIDWQFNERGQLIRAAYMEPNGHGGETIKYQVVYDYDEYGRIIDSQRLTADGAPYDGED